MGRLDSKVALVTGAASGLGKAIATRFAEEGAKVVIADVDEEKGREVADSLADALFVQVDVTKADSVQAMVGAAKDHYGQLDILINNAGIDGEQAPTAEASLENWHRVIDINLHGVFYGMKYGIAAMKERGEGGVVINMGSTAGLVGFGDIPPYTASKAAVIHLAKAAALEYAKDSIRCYAICPAVVLTPLVEHFIESSPDPDERRAMFENMNPMPGMAKPEDVANTALFLASSEARYLTGVVVPVDGGYTVQ